MQIFPWVRYDMPPVTYTMAADAWNYIGQQKQPQSRNVSQLEPRVLIWWTPSAED